MASLLDLPCRWRKHEVKPGLYRCDSAKLLGAKAGVPLTLCAGCNLRDHEPIEPQPKRVSLDCIHRGRELRSELCPSCRGKVKVKVFGCALHKECTLAKAIDGAKLCSGCPDKAEGQAESIIRIDPHLLTPASAHFNCSLIEWGGRTLLAYRARPTDSTLHIAELGPHWQPTRTQPIPLDVPGIAAYEDPRLFTYADTLWLSFVGTQIGQVGIMAHQFIVPLGDDLQPLAAPLQPLYPDRQYPMEKNWTYFESGGGLYCVYTISPHVVLSIAKGLAVKVSETGPVSWSGGLLRGGASPVLVGDEWYAFFHGVEQHDGGRRTYTVGCYTFENRPPFAIKRLAPAPLYVPPAHPDKRHRIAFPCGAIRRDGHWVISMGTADEFCDLLFLKEARVEAALKPA